MDSEGIPTATHHFSLSTPLSTTLLTYSQNKAVLTDLKTEVCNDLRCDNAQQRARIFREKKGL